MPDHSEKYSSDAVNSHGSRDEKQQKPGAHPTSGQPNHSKDQKHQNTPSQRETVSNNDEELSGKGRKNRRRRNKAKSGNENSTGNSSKGNESKQQGNKQGGNSKQKRNNNRNHTKGKGKEKEDKEALRKAKEEEDAAARAHAIEQQRMRDEERRVELARKTAEDAAELGKCLIYRYIVMLWWLKEVGEEVVCGYPYSLFVD